MINGTIKPIKSTSAIGQHLLNNLDCSKNYNANRFSIVTRGPNSYYFFVLKPLFIKTVKPNLCKQKIFYKNNLYHL